MLSTCVGPVRCCEDFSAAAAGADIGALSTAEIGLSLS